MALNDYKPNEFLPEPLRVWLKQPQKVSVYRSYDYLRMFSGQDLLAIMNNNLANNIASGFTNANYSNLMSGIAPRMLEILVNKIINKVDYIGYENCQELEDILSKEYLTIKLDKAYNNAIRTGRDLLVLYPKGEEIDKAIQIRNVECFRHRLIYDDEEIREVYILADKIEAKANENYMIFEHRFFSNDGKPMQEYTCELYSWRNDELDKTNKYKFTKEEMNRLVEKLEASIAEALKQYKFYKPVELPFRGLGCYDIKNSIYNSKFPSSSIPESRFVNVQDKIMEIENSITYKEMDKNLGRGRATIPSSFNFAHGLALGGANASNLANKGAFVNPLDSTFFVQYNTNASDKAVAPQGIQFDIRSEAWRTSLNGEIGDLCAVFGISILDFDPRLLQSGQRTDDEINAMTDITADTVSKLRNINEYKINQMLNDIVAYSGLEPKDKDGNIVKFAIKWNIASIINPTKNQTLIGMQLQNGTISRKEAIKRSNPDYTEQEIEEELKAIQEERGLAEANAIF
jgi:hypothetical protein